MLEAVNNSCEYMYDTSKNKWVYIGKTKPTLFISTEVTIKSLITMIISFISGVEEWKIKRRKCNDEEKERIKKAREIFKKGNLHLEYISSFTLESLDALMQKYILTKDIEFLYFDYIQASASVIASVSKRSGNRSLGTDKVLEVFSTELKELANNYFLNFNTSSQVNRGQDGERELGRTRGAYSLPDKFDNVMMSGKPTNKEMKKFEDLKILEGFLKPNYTITILKNRDGEHNDIILWYHLNKGNMRFTYLGCTDIEVSEEYELTIDKYVYENAKEE